MPHPTHIIRQISRPHLEVSRPPGLRCPGCGNVPRDFMLFMMMPPYMKFHCPVCGATLLGNTIMAVLDVISYICTAGLFLFALRFQRYLGPIVDFWGYGIIGIACIAIVKTPFAYMQRARGKYRRIYD
jgi:hypothetical protein